MKKHISYISALALAAGLCLTGCTSSFEEINTDPDAYTAVPVNNRLTWVIRTIGEELSSDLEGPSTYGGQIVKIQYLDYYSFSNSTYARRWGYHYTVNANLQDLLDATEESAEGNKNGRWIARILMDWVWQDGTDTWRDMPYTGALKGSEAKGGILTSAYDKQEDIYPAVMADLKAIADEMAAGFGSDDVSTGDQIYQGDMEKWQKFCNSLRLRMAMRISAVSADLAKSTIEEICGNPSKYPILESSAENCYLYWPGSSPYYERWFDNSRTRDDHGLSDIFVDHLKAMNDPRLDVIAHPAEKDGEYRGFQNGPANQPTEMTTISRIGWLYRDDPAGFTPFLRSCENYYILAEAALMGWNVGISAQEAYEKAVRLSMEDNGLSAEDAEAFLAGKGKWDGTKDRIYWDMWVALFKESTEVWSLYRRTGIPTTNYPAIESVWKGIHDEQPYRMPYPENQEIYNAENLAPYAANIVDYAWGQKMWWAK